MSLWFSCCVKMLSLLSVFLGVQVFLFLCIHYCGNCFSDNLMFYSVQKVASVTRSNNCLVSIIAAVLFQKKNRGKKIAIAVITLLNEASQLRYYFRKKKNFLEPKKESYGCHHCVDWFSNSYIRTQKRCISGSNKMLFIFESQIVKTFLYFCQKFSYYIKLVVYLGKQFYELLNR